MDGLRNRIGPRWFIAAVALAVALIVAAFLGALVASEVGDDDEADVAPVAVVAEPASSGVGVGDEDALEPVPEPDDMPIAPAELRQVEAAALTVTGGGTVSEIDRSDDLGEAFEVEVIVDGAEVDVALNENLRRVPNLRYDDP